MANIYFIGVTTGQSAMANIFPLWSNWLNLNLNLIGVDLPVDADSSQFRRAVEEIKRDDDAIGCLVTTHKVKLFEYASDLFDEFDALAEMTREISAITKQESRLAGFAVSECLSTTFALKSILDADYWNKHQSDVVCFGAGGAARAIILSLLFDFELTTTLDKRRLHKPRRLFLVDIDQTRLQSVAALLEPLREDLEIEYIHHHNAEDNDLLLANSARGSLVINATGMGKDRPGSPITNLATFPIGSLVWELNYRGERQFLKQAKSQEAQQTLKVHDGWICFMHGWTQTLQLVLQKPFTPEQFHMLVKIAEPFRSASVQESIAP
jgi:shikimate dehydrogenase